VLQDFYADLFRRFVEVYCKDLIFEDKHELKEKMIIVAFILYQSVHEKNPKATRKVLQELTSSNDDLESIGSVQKMATVLNNDEAFFLDGKWVSEFRENSQRKGSKKKKKGRK